MADEEAAGPEASDDEPSRRDFLRTAGIGAAGLAVGGAAGAAVTAAATAHVPQYAPLAERSAPGFDHVVVLMFENRSFDNVLGRLYTAAEKDRAAFDGILQGRTPIPGRAATRSTPTCTTGRPIRSCSSRSPTPARPTRMSTRSCSA